ncbi:hypothetical protein GP486_005910, partial [Trichoglossum hirsutum]
MESAPIPDHCDICDEQDLRRLQVCSSNRCNPNVALCVLNCSECRKPCGIPGHLSCWDSHITGNRERRATHAGRPAENQLRVNDILQSETDAGRQRELHQQDKKARWFIAGSTREDGSYGMLYVTDRFEYLTSRASMRGQSGLQQFPSLVSFIGETGTGKSTLIRALIKMSLQERSQPVETPVTRIAHSDMLSNPTSSGVHLYRDPATNMSRRPILFADCEGFNAGAGVPTSRYGEDAHRVIRKIPITSRLYAGDAKSSAVEELYSRFLYAFSDVVCFVTKSEQTITYDFQRLLEWASRGLQTSVNQTQHRTLIIILNARMKHDPELMDEDTAKSRMFNSVGNVWENSPALKKIRDKTNRSDIALNNHIFSTRDFLHKYFPTIKVCYVPLQVNTRLGEVGKQYELLRKQVVQGATWASDTRERTWMQYNIQDLSRLYGLAFEHYATSHRPLDFYRAARKDNPDPQNMADHIMNLLRHTENTEDESLTQFFPRIVASTLLNDTLRGGGLMYDPQHVWASDYSETCRNGVLRFYREHAVCSHVDDGSRCICRYNGHDDGHRFTNGGFKKGHFEPQDIENRVSELRDQIQKQFLSQYHLLCHSDEQMKKPSAEEIIEHRRDALADTANTGLWRKLHSYKTCFTCLRTVPDHCLPCGHALCEFCVMDFGNASPEQESAILLERCILCSDTWNAPQLIKLKPRCAGVRVLTLDGGGVKGILEIAMLLKLEERIGLGLPIQEFFDLVIGTSTGGIIALGMAMKNLMLPDLMAEFKKITTATFKHNRAPRNKVTQAITENGIVQKFLLSTRLWESIYATDPLQKELQNTLGSELGMFGASRTTGYQRSMRVAVTAVKNGGRQPTIIANYNHRNRDVISDIDFERAENEEEELMAWEAGLCTAAAPVFFTPYQKEATKTTYLDGGLSHNNPIYAAMEEYRKIWPDSSLANPDILVSVGTGSFAKNKVELPKVFDDSWLSNLLNSYLNNINGEATWERFWSSYQRVVYPRVHYRLNFRFPDNVEYCRIDQHERIEELISVFESSFSRSSANGPSNRGLSETLDQTANLLIAKLFYFEPTHEKEVNYAGGAPSYLLRGRILCRLPRNSNALKKLVERVHSFTAGEGSTAIDAMRGTVLLQFGDNVRAAVRDSNWKFKVDHVIETVEPSDMVQNISIRLVPEGGVGQMHVLPISGFPCTFN